VTWTIDRLIDARFLTMGNIVRKQDDTRFLDTRQSGILRLVKEDIRAGNPLLRSRRQ